MEKMGDTSAGRISPSQAGSWRSSSMVASGIDVLRAISVSRNQMLIIGARSSRRTWREIGGRRRHWLDSDGMCIQSGSAK